VAITPSLTGSVRRTMELERGSLHSIAGVSRPILQRCPRYRPTSILPRMVSPEVWAGFAPAHPTACHTSAVQTMEQLIAATGHR